MLLLGLFFTQCRKDTVTENSGTNIITPSDGVTMLIHVIDEDQKPVENAVVRLVGNGDITNTDEYGASLFKDLTIPSGGTLAIIEHPDYETQYKTLTAVSDSKGITKVMLLKDLFTTTIRTGEEGNIDDRGFLTLPSTLESLKGTPYAGEVQVKSKYLDPDDLDFIAQVPGSLIGQNSEDEYSVMASLGIYLIELYNPNTGEKLNIPDGEKATIKFPIADLHKGSIPSEVALSSFDESTGIWKEEGTATSDGEFMVAEVKHFSFWLCSLPYTFVPVKMTFVDENDALLKNVTIIFSVDKTLVFGVGITDIDGVIQGKIPLNEEIKIELIIGNDIFYTTTIDPITNNADLLIKLYGNPKKILGNAFDCTGDIVQEGYAYIEIPAVGQTELAIFDSDGNFEINTIHEDQNLTLVNLIDAKFKQIFISKAELDNSPLMLFDLMLCDETEMTSISGFVKIDTDEDGIDDGPSENIEVKVVDKNSGFKRTVTTNQDGEYSANVPPGNYTISILPTSEVKVRSSGDFSIDDPSDEGGYVDQTSIQSTVTILEKDTDNNFQLIKTGAGSISGSLSLDFNYDDIVDKRPSGIQVLARDIIDNKSYVAITDFNGNYRMEDIPNSKYNIYIDTFGFNNSISDYDMTPDPDGDDSALGANKTIPAVVTDGESDEDNNFFNIMEKSIIVCSVLEDTDNDNIGDKPIEGQRVELYKRDPTGVPQSPAFGGGNTDENGNIIFRFLEPGEYVLYYIGPLDNPGDYDFLGGTDVVPDNNPPNTSGNLIFMPVDIIDVEYDDGNTYVFKKK